MSFQKETDASLLFICQSCVIVEQLSNSSRKSYMYLIFLSPKQEKNKKANRQTDKQTNTRKRISILTHYFLKNQMFRALALRRSLCPTAFLCAPTHPYAEALTVTPRCFDNIQRINRNEHVANEKRFLRLAIESGGCQGFSYKFYFDDEFDPEQDIKFEISNATAEIDGVSSSTSAKAANPNVPSPMSTAPIPSSAPEPTSVVDDGSEPFVVADKETLTKMKGGIIDYHTELKGSAFVVVGNEYVDHSCACAQSFSLRK